MCLGLGACSNDDTKENASKDTTNSNSLTGWWKANSSTHGEYRGNIKYYYLALHFLSDQAVEVADITEEKQWFFGTNEFAVNINGIDYYYVNRSTYAYKRDNNIITVLGGDYKTFVLDNGQIHGDHWDYKKVK